MPGLPSADESLRQPIARRRQPERSANAGGLGPVVNDRSLHGFRKGSLSHAPRDHRSIASVTLGFLERLVDALEQGVDERVSLRLSLRVRYLRAAIRSMGRQCFPCPVLRNLLKAEHVQDRCRRAVLELGRVLQDEERLFRAHQHGDVLFAVDRIADRRSIDA
jgi:hypothetical protein